VRRRGRRRRAELLAAGVAVAVAATLARARLAPAAEVAPAAAPATPVEITVAGSAADLRRVRDLVEPWRAGGAAPRWARAQAIDPAEILRGDRDALRCWVDLTSPRRARLYFAARSGERFLVRDVELPGGFDEIGRQSLAEVLELSLAALLADERAGLSRAEAQALLDERQRAAARPAEPAPSPPVPLPAAPPAAPPPSLAATPAAPGAPSPLGVGVFYAAQIPGGELPVAHGPGLALDLDLGPGRRRALAAWLEGRYQLPEHAARDTIGLDLSTIAARAGLGLRFATGSAAGDDARALRPRAVALRVGAGVDFVQLRPEAGSGGGAPALTPARWSTSLVLTGAAALALAAGRRASVELRLFADLLPVAVHYDLEVDGRASPVFSPWRVRPGLALAVTLH
jgi:hypothetical protein